MAGTGLEGAAFSGRPSWGSSLTSPSGFSSLSFSSFVSSGFFSLALGCAGAADPSLPPGDGTPASTGATAQELLASAKSVRAPAQSRSRWSPALNWDDDRTFSHNQPIRLTVLQPGQKSKPGLPQPLQFIQAEEPTLRNKQEHVSLTPGAGLHIYIYVYIIYKGSRL